MKLNPVCWIALMSVISALPLAGQQVSWDPQKANISGTVMDAENDVVPGAKVELVGAAPGDVHAAVSGDNGAFAFDNLPAADGYRVTVSADGFATWTSPEFSLRPAQFLMLPAAKLVLAGGTTSVTVYASSHQLATEQVNIEEKQRVLGFVPNFWVVYDPNPVPLTTQLKFRLALRAELDPVTLLGAGLVSAMDQAGNTPDYPQGATGFAQRFGANYATGLTDVMLGGAILPSLLHQDPRYFYQGTGTIRSRLFHALSSPFICRGDNGRLQPNYSSLGGDLATGAIAQTWSPATNRGSGLVFQNVLIVTGGRMASSAVQEFVLRRFTSGAGRRNR